MSSVRVKGGGLSNRSAVKKMIEDIQEITGHNHSDDEIHAMLKECSMDPNEAAHRLLLLDKFHEVKSKRDRRKENQIKELSEKKWKPGTQAWANRAGRGNYSSRYKSNDAGGRTDLASGKGSGTGHISEKGVRNSFSSKGTESVNHLNLTVNPPLLASVEVIADSSTKNISASAGDAAIDVGISVMEQKVPNELQEVGKSPLLTKSSAISSSSTIRLLSPNCNNPSLVSGSQKVGPVREWKPKSVTVSNDEGATIASPSEVPLVSSKEATTSDLQKKMGKLSVSERKHVIIPEHLHVPEVEKLGFCFGSFDASFGLDSNKHVGPASEESLPVSGSSESVDDEPVTDETKMSYLHESVAVDNTVAEYRETLKSHSQDPENLQSVGVEATSSSTIDNVVAPSNYNLSPVPSALTCQFAPLLISDSQARDAPCQPSFSMPQSVDPSSYYAQFYRSGMDSNGGISPFHTGGASMKNNGSAPLVSAQAHQIPQEFQGGFPLILSLASPLPLTTQAAGVMQSSINPSQQPLHVFRQPSVVALPHYNNIPYGGPYFSPFYVPPPTVNPYLSNSFPQQLQPAKYSQSQYKQGLNTGAPNYTGLPVNYGAYGLSMAPITFSSNEDNAAASYAKESNIDAGGQQSEGSNVWFARDIPAFYNVPQAQLALTPNHQQGHGTTFTRFLHPADIGGQNATVYQQPRINWPGDY